MNCKSIRISLWFSSSFLPPVIFCEYWRYLWIFEWLALNAFKNLALIWADSNFCCGKEEWFRLQRPWLQRSSASDSNLRRCIEEWFRLQNGLATASILDFSPRLSNRCRVLPGNALGAAVILNLMGWIWKSLQGFARKQPPACSDSWFQAQTWESLQHHRCTTMNGPPADGRGICPRCFPWSLSILAVPASG